MFLCFPIKFYHFLNKIELSKGRGPGIYNPPAGGLDLTMKCTLNVIFDYGSIPLGTYLKLDAQAGFLSNFEKSPFLCFWSSRLT